MKIETKMSLFQEIWIPFMICLIMVALFSLTERTVSSIIISILFLFFAGCYLSLVYITGQRTIDIDCGGVTISLHKYSRHYCWNEIEMKQLISPQFGNNNQFRYGGIFFSVKMVHLPLVFDPVRYCVFRHPLKCFWISFAPKEYPNNSISSRYYEVDKQEILILLQKWGISLSN